MYFDKMMQDYIFTLFGTSEEFLKKGFGFCIMHDQKVVCAAATAHPPVDHTFEIQIVTRKEYRRQGLATIAAAYLIAYSLENGYDPKWDADNETSAKLAEKLGYSNPVSYKIHVRAKLPVVILRKLKINNLIRIILKVIGKYQE
jgi:RimJ/RimL family protein N-acetyltransferase